MRRLLRTTLACVLLLAAPARADFETRKLSELFGTAEVVAAGEIESVEDATFVLRVERAIVGTAVGERLSVVRFRDWMCASRWAPYEVGQRVVVFLGPSWQIGGPSRSILGAGGEGEWPFVGERVLAPGQRVRGMERGRHAVPGASREQRGVLLELDELERVVRAFRACREAGPLAEPQGAVETLRASSALGRHVVEEVRASGEWPTEPPRPDRVWSSAGVRLDAEALGASGEPRRRRRGWPELIELDTGFGSALALLGDVDGDGVDDLAVGAPQDGLREHFRGALWIVFLRPDGSARDAVEVDADGGWADLGPDAQLGSALAPLGDLDGDGVPDLLAAAPVRTEGSERRGGVWALFLRPDGTLREARELLGQSGLASALPAAGFGVALAYLGDRDGDGATEVALVEQRAVEGGAPASPWVVSLDATGVVRRAVRVLPGGFPDGPDSIRAVASPGDVDGDGLDDLVVSDPVVLGRERPPAGGVWIAFLDRSGRARRTQRVGVGASGIERRVAAGDVLRFGLGLAAPGDLDGDGVPELLVGSNRGVWLLSLRRDGTAREHRWIVVPRDPESPYGTWTVAMHGVPRPPGSARLALGGRGKLEPREGVHLPLRTLLLTSLDADGRPGEW